MSAAVSRRQFRRHDGGRESQCGHGVWSVHAPHRAYAAGRRRRRRQFTDTSACPRCRRPAALIAVLFASRRTTMIITTTTVAACAGDVWCDIHAGSSWAAAAAVAAAGRLSIPLSHRRCSVTLHYALGRLLTRRLRRGAATARAGGARLDAVRLNAGRPSPSTAAVAVTSTP